MYRIDLEARLRKLRHHRDYMAWQSGRANGHRGSGGNPGGPGRPAGHAGGPGGPGGHAGRPGGRASAPGEAGPCRAGTAPGRAGTAPGRAGRPTRAMRPIRPTTLISPSSPFPAPVPAPPAPAGERHAAPGSDQQAAGLAPPPSPDQVGPPAAWMIPARRPLRPVPLDRPDQAIDQMADVLGLRRASRQAHHEPQVGARPVCPERTSAAAGIVWLARPAGHPGTGRSSRGCRTGRWTGDGRSSGDSASARTTRRGWLATTSGRYSITAMTRVLLPRLPAVQAGQPGSTAAGRGQLTLAWSAQVIYEVLSGLITASAPTWSTLTSSPETSCSTASTPGSSTGGCPGSGTRASRGPGRRGTPFFACPEQLSHPRQGWDTPRADLYGVGATFYWLMTGEAPFQREVEAGGDNPMEYMRLLVPAAPQPVHDLVPGIPRELGT